jgi:hypothetical protein
MLCKVNSAVDDIMEEIIYSLHFHQIILIVNFNSRTLRPSYTTQPLPKTIASVQPAYNLNCTVQIKHTTHPRCRS